MSEPQSRQDDHHPPADAEPAVMRRHVLALLGGLGLIAGPLSRALAAQVAENGAVSVEMIRQAEWIAGLELTDQQREKLARDLQKSLRELAQIRAVPCDADIPPASVFRPDFFAEPDADVRLAAQQRPPGPSAPPNYDPQARPRFSGNDADLAYASLLDQAAWLASGEISSVELTKLYLERLERADPQLHCVVTMLGDWAIEQARAADARRSRGVRLGLLDGIPWVAKDLIAVPPWTTTWGAEPFRNQVRPTLATVAERLQNAGGVLLAKVSLGALAWGDVWFGGTTRNPWEPEKGSSGSSAGTASSIAAGLASYGIGSETLGSIVSPCVRCRVSGLRPTYGRISRFGCMPLAWSFDKLGPIARGVEDLAVIFSTLIGPDGRDPTVVARPFRWPDRRPLDELTIGTTNKRLTAADQQALDWLIDQGAQHITVDLPSRFPLSALTVMLNVEAATMFDDTLRDDPSADLGLWPDSFRKSQFVSAVHYLRASRLRSMLVAETEQVLRSVDILLGADDLTLTNLSGHPSLVVALGTEAEAGGAPRPATVKLTAAMFRESTLLAVGQALQSAIPPTPDRPALFP